MTISQRQRNHTDMVADFQQRFFIMCPCATVDSQYWSFTAVIVRSAGTDSSCFVSQYLVPSDETKSPRFGHGRRSDSSMCVCVHVCMCVCLLVGLWLSITMIARPGVYRVLQMISGDHGVI
jgi:hypothetical protein